MNILIIGAGIVGYNLAEELSEEGHDIAIIDKDQSKIKDISGKFDILAITGDATRLNVLKSAGIQTTEMIIAVTNSDEANIVICMLAAKFGIKNRIARIRNEDYTADDHVLDLEGSYISRIINPDKIVTDYIIQTIQTPGSTYVETFADGEILLRGFDVTENAPIQGKTLAELKDTADMDTFLIGGISRDNGLIIPHGPDQIKTGDNILVLIAKDTLPLFLPLVNKRIWGVKRVVIYGCDDRAISLAKQLETNIKEVILLAEEEKQAECASGILNKTIVMHGKGTDLDMLEQVNIKETDYFIAISGDDETNLTSSLLAKRNGAHRTVVITHDPDYVPILDSIGIDVVINPRLITVGAILEYVRRGKIRHIVKLATSEAEVIEMVATENSKITTKPLKDLKFPRDALIGAVIKDKLPVIPRGNTTIKPGERVVVFALPQAIKHIESLFASN